MAPRPTRKENPFLARERAAKAAPEQPRGEDTEHEDLLAVVHEMVARERLHVPPALDEDPVELPFDLTTVSDTELQQLYSAFAAYSYRAGYLLMLEEAAESKCREAADEIVTAYLAAQGEGKDTVTQLKAQAEQHDDVHRWRKRQQRHGILAASLRKDRDNYDKVCERLSRIETMRHDEWERSGNRLASRKTR